MDGESNATVFSNSLYKSPWLEELRKMADLEFQVVGKYGRHPDVFCCQNIDELENRGLVLIRSSFFEGMCVSVIMQ
jgi:hypothetical protein